VIQIEKNSLDTARQGVANFSIITREGIIR
jgi:hypothetical protein